MKQYTCTECNVEIRKSSLHLDDRILCRRCCSKEGFDLDSLKICTGVTRIGTFTCKYLCGCVCTYEKVVTSWEEIYQGRILQRISCESCGINFPDWQELDRDKGEIV